MKAGNCAGSEWPLALMIDEIWLRVHRVLVHELESSNLWPETQSYQAFLKEQKEAGFELKRQLLYDVLGEMDYAYLGSEALFGASNYRFRSRLPFVLAFGYELGASFDRLLCGGPTRYTSEVAASCALFNLGISIFDLVYDHQQDLFTLFSQRFNEQTMEQLATEPGSYSELAADLVAPELRILLKVISAFYRRIHLLYLEGQQKDTWATLSILLHHAYQAEIHSAGDNWEASADLMAISRSKSTLPFSILYNIACLDSQMLNPDVKRTVEAIAENVAEIFWLTDDLADIVRDLRDGGLNSLLLRVNGDGCWRSEAEGKYMTMATLLQSSSVEDVTNDICNELISMVTSLENINVDGTMAIHFQQVILTFLRNWLD